jgi:glyoxylase-like metal-dependent hydrolase (beta-lactamase superfamily II)
MTGASDGPVVVPIPNGQYQENAYLVADPASGGAVLIDPGEEADRFLREIDERGWRLEAIWLTHAHVDHVMGVGAVKAATGVPVLLHPADRPLYDHAAEQAQWLGLKVDPLPVPDQDLAAGDTLTVGRFRFDVRHTPGHSPGHVCLIGDGIVFGGDVLFQGSVGRVDLPGGDAGALLASIREHLMTLPDDTVVYSGHGPPTTIGDERLHNPYVTGVVPLA